MGDTKEKSNSSSDEDPSPQTLHGTDRRGTENLEYDDMLSTANIKTVQPAGIPDVYEIAAAIGTAMEPILEEFGQSKLEPLTKEVVRCLETFEKTVSLLTKETEKSLEYQYALEKSNHDIEVQNKKHQREMDRNDDTILQLQATIDTLQMSHDTLVENWEFEAEQSNQTALEELERQPSQAEISLAKQLRETVEKCQKLERQIVEKQDDIEILAEQVQKYVRLESIANSSQSTNDKESTNNIEPLPSENKVSLSELQKVLREKNYFKEKCYAMEDQFTEYKMMLANLELEKAGAVESLSVQQQQSSAGGGGMSPSRSLSRVGSSASSFLKMISPSRQMKQKIVNTTMGLVNSRTSSVDTQVSSVTQS